MKSRVPKSDLDDELSLLSALVESTETLPRAEITMDTLAAIARSSATIASTSKAPLPFLDPAAVKALPKGTRAFIVVATNAGDDGHCALTVGVLRPDGARCTKTLYASKKACG